MISVNWCIELCCEYLSVHNISFYCLWLNSDFCGIDSTYSSEVGMDFRLIGERLLAPKGSGLNDR